MKKTLNDLKDIESYFMEADIKPNNGKPAVKNSKTFENQILSLENDIKKLKIQNNNLELQVDSLSSNKSKNFKKNDTAEIASMFLDFSVDKHLDKETQKTINDLKAENEKIKAENKKLLKIQTNNELEKREKSFKKVSYTNIYESIKKQYSFLSENSIVAISTAEYLYQNETNAQIDYSGPYINYVKALEIELKKVFRLKTEKETFGNLVEKLKKNPTFKTFVEKLEHEKVGEIRNKAVHQRPISKHECGKIRKLFFEDNWLDRISFLVEDSLKNKENEKIQFKTYVIDKKGQFFVNDVNYYHYTTDGDMDILSINSNLSGFVKGTGLIKAHNEENYIIF